MASGTDFPRITMYTTSWCGDCRRSKRLLDRHGVPYEEINIEGDGAAAALVMQLNNGRRTVPTIVIEGGPVLAEPSDRELARALSLPV
jgi:mycoredoxin